MAGTKMYGKLSKDDLRKLSTTTDQGRSPALNGVVHSNWIMTIDGSLDKSKSKGVVQNGLHRTVNSKGVSMVPIHQVLKSDQLVKIGRMRIKAAHVRSSYFPNSQLHRSNSTYALSITRDLAFGKKCTDIEKGKITLEDRISSKIPDAPCLGRLALMALVFLLVLMVYILKLKQNSLDKHLKEKWEEENASSNNNFHLSNSTPSSRI